MGKERAEGHDQEGAEGGDEGGFRTKVESVQSRPVWSIRSQMAHPPHRRLFHFRALRCVCVFPFFVSGDAYAPLFRSIGITLAFVIPRVPDFAINGTNPLTTATGWFNQSIPAEFSRAPANFSFPANIQLQVDTNSNFLPVVFKSLDAQVYDLNSFRLVGLGHMNRTKLPAKKFTNIQLPLNFSYVATNDSDLTCQSAFLSVLVLPGD